MFDYKLIKTTTKLFDVFICGEILIDIIEDYGGEEHRLFGGSPGNIAINTTQLGLKTKLFAAISHDHLGRALKQTLTFYNVDTSLLLEVERPQSYVKLKQTATTPIPTFSRGSDFILQCKDDVVEALQQSKIFHFSYWPLTREPSKSTVLSLINHAKDAGTLVSFDPNLHEALLHEDSISTPMLHALLSKVDIIKPSLDDASRLLGEGKTKEEYMTEFENFGIPLILMTLGKDGVYTSYHKTRTLFPTQAKNIVDATGAGDAFWSGLYSGLVEGLPLDHTVHLAQSVSALVLQALGAITPLPHYSQLLEGDY